MKQLTAVLLCLLLCGCTRQAPTPPPETIPETTSPPVMAGLYDHGHPMEQQYPGLVRAYPLTMQQVHGIRAFGKDVLVLSGEDRTTLTLFTGDTLQETASLMLDFSLRQEDPSLQIHENSLSYFDPGKQTTVQLDRRLQETRRITAPSGLAGVPILSSDEDTLYYCTDWAVMAWDLSSGIRRTVKELSYEAQELTALHLDDTLLECSIRDSGINTRLLLDSAQGSQLAALPDDAVVHTGKSRYFAELISGYQTLMLFGEPDGAPELLLPAQNWQQQFYLPEDHAAVTVSISEHGTQLNYYELNTGILRSALSLETQQFPKAIVNSKGHSIYILTSDAGGDILYRWDVLRQQPDPDNVTAYTSAYHSAEAPDTAALELCREYADTIGRKYGISIQIWEDAVAVHPWDYRFEPEHLAPVLLKELKLLDERLAQYPEGILRQSTDHFAGLKICLVRKITGAAEDRSLGNATGIQFLQHKEAYVVITTGEHSEQALHHELYHVMETHILTESTALDQWESLNPAGFVYGSQQQDDDIYLRGQTRAFVDRYSMNAAKEDRARVLENALLPGKQELFRSEYMQRKLRALCTGIREAYELKEYPEKLPWEQYLVSSLVSES